MAKAQAHFRLEPDLLEAIKVKAEEEKITVTELVTRFLMQGLGLDIHNDIQSVNQIKIEESVYQRVSDHITTQLSELEESMLKRVAVRISDLNDNWEKHIPERVTSQFTELEKRVLECVASSISNLEANWEKRISDCITKPKLNKEKMTDIQSEKRIPEENKISKSDTEKPERISNSVSFGYTDNPQEIQAENKTLTLFNTELNEQILKPNKLATLLNEKTNSKDWSIRKLKSLRLRQITWIKNHKNSDKKIIKEPILPLKIENYLIDWVISNDDDENATGKQWWVKELSSNESEIEALIKERKEKYIAHYFKDNV